MMIVVVGEFKTDHTGLDDGFPQFSQCEASVMSCASKSRYSVSVDTLQRLLDA